VKKKQAAALAQGVPRRATSVREESVQKKQHDGSISRCPNKAMGLTTNYDNVKQEIHSSFSAT
jgi:hypothetical protein